MEEQERGPKLEEKMAEWESFVKKAKIKTANHTTMVRFYNAVYNFMIMTVILIAGILTCIILLGGIDKMVLAALSGACTILTACSKFLVADRKKAGHKRFAKLFQTLLIRMLRCETIVEYNALRHELTEAIIREPLVLIWHQRKSRTELSYTMTARLELALDGKEETPLNNMSPVHQHQYSGHGSNKPFDFNPHDFHVMSLGEPSGRNSREGYVAISGFQDQPQRNTSKNGNHEKSIMEQVPEEKMSLISSSSKGKKKKMKAESEKSFQSKNTFLAASSQGTLDEIEEEQETEEQQNLRETSETMSLNSLRKGKKKKGSTQSNFPPPPPMTEGDDDCESGSQQVQISSRMGTSSSRNIRGMSGRNDHRSIVYDEEEENMLSEDSDNMDDDMTYTRN
ncbi:uncharacterized protein LOC114521840 isoform X2 [Dendronephthya gigantea]|uniref:uncharacterized protein LOC114521840 isoform X2 n=1 Tax=Dendronephthya gigantea TaxID=151771 RepID=UPI00106BC43B|nr:uncharacterized protein LOC114521840 isoform X2 [Dendronephthya gigantea]